MALDAAVFEKLGAFYLGRPYDLPTRTPEDVPLLYDSRDLVTHAVCVGMTGSGKTGLCLALLEEAAIDGVPAIVIDPKGDLGNLLLTFPELRPEDFRPWINEEDARRKELSPDAYAAQQADLWKSGLAKWGQAPERIGELRKKVEMAIYTPGSTAGIPVNVLASFEAPDTEDLEALADRVQTTTASLLGLLKLDADPVKSRESILISAVLSTEWKAGRSLDLAGLIGLIQSPPFKKIGVLDLESFYPAKDRFALVMAINNVLASPNFANWQIGEPLDAGRFLYTAEGKPRVSIFSIAHLGDDERMFFVSLLLNEVLSWTRSQSGTTSLRAILYMDEIFGYLPPTANPPSKLPMLTLLKQARAFGVGIVLATQNPVDLDYKALSNAGTWFIGRLQTERDKARVLDGLQGAAAGGKFDRAGMESALAGLGNRVFLMNNVHEDGPVIFETRWIMSYLRGPLTRDQIKVLMAPKKAEAKPGEPAAPVREAAPTVAGGKRPALPPAVPQVFLPVTTAGNVSYTPSLLGAATVRFNDAKLGVDGVREMILSTGLPGGAAGPDWANAEELDVTLDELEKEPVEEAAFAEVAASASQAKNYKAWEKDFVQALAVSQTLDVFRCADTKEVSKVGETEAEFRIRTRQALSEARDRQIEAIQKKYAPKKELLESRLARAKVASETQKSQANQARLQTLISVGSALMGAILGRKKLSSANINKAATAARSVGRTMKEGADVGAAESSIEAITQKMAELNAELQDQIAAIQSTDPKIESLKIKPARGGITVRCVALAWTPSTG